MEGTASPYLTRLLIRTGLAAGLDHSQLAAVPGLAVVDEDGIRIPTATVLRTWETVSGPLRQAGGVGRVMQVWRPGALGVWDYLFTAAGTLGEAIGDAGRHIAVMADPADDVTAERDDEGGVTFSWRGLYDEHPVYPLIAEYVPSLVLAEARSGLGRSITPVAVRLPHRPPARRDHLIELYGTRNIDFDTGQASITFAEADAEARLPHADPALAAILGNHAQLSVATAKPVLGWLDRFRAAMETVLATGTPELAEVANRLGIGPRTLQRRLRDEGTSWREELERLRQARVDRLLRETSLSVEAIAARVGYIESRSLRRAIHRWYGHGPAKVRDTTP